MNTSTKLLALAGAAVIAAGCSGGGTHSRPTRLSITRFGGVVFLTSGPSGSIADAIFVKAMTPESQGVFDFADGTCQLPGSSILSTASVPTFADAGASVAFTSGATTITALKSTSFGISYGVSGAPVVPDTDWTVSAAGGPDVAAGTLASFHLPAPITLTNAPVLTPGQPAEVTFTANVGAEAILLSISGNDGFASCYSNDDGAFTIPGTVTAAVGSNASVSVSAVNLGLVNVGGRQVLTEVASGP